MVKKSKNAFNIDNPLQHPSFTWSCCDFDWNEITPYHATKKDFIELFCGCCGRIWQCGPKDFKCKFFPNSDKDVTDEEWMRQTKELEMQIELEQNSLTVNVPVSIEYELKEESENDSVKNVKTNV